MSNNGFVQEVLKDFPSPIRYIHRLLSFGLRSWIFPFFTGPLLCMILLLFFGLCLLHLLMQLISFHVRQVQLQLLLQQGYQPLSSEHQNYHSPWTRVVKPSKTKTQAPAPP